MATAAPPAAKRRAIASPIPRLAPVTIATRPVISPIVSASPHCCTRPSFPTVALPWGNTPMASDLPIFDGHNDVLSRLLEAERDEQRSLGAIGKANGKR